MAAACAAMLTGCGSSKDKAEELIKTTGLTEQYGVIVDIASSAYATQYPMLGREQIRNVVRQNLPQDALKDAMVEVYADHFDDDELDLMIRANQHPEQAMAIILGSKDGRELALKVVEVQKTMMQDMQDAMSDNDEAIVDALDDLKDQAEG
ncbi:MULTISPECIES: hypothetical protein [Pseudomonas]|uniref:hypothetical protein n=1 Tax=Pseudomonas TaxID=286 RepID=UPI001E34D94B|nr:hypothetical protein [Pseudomonas guariconensis]